ncbi:MAG: hypothetical protein ACLFRX_01280 [Gemmatimonadota bacterium]
MESHRGRPSWPTLVLLALMAALPGCEAGGTADPEEGLSREEFVEVVVALREAERDLPSDSTAPERFAEVKAEILAEHDVTEVELRAFLEGQDEDLARLQELWDTINRRLKFVPEEGRAPRGGPVIR